MEAEAARGATEAYPVDILEDDPEGYQVAAQTYYELLREGAQTSTEVISLSTGEQVRLETSSLCFCTLYRDEPQHKILVLVNPQDTKTVFELSRVWLCTCRHGSMSLPYIGSPSPLPAEALPSDSDLWSSLRTLSLSLSAELSSPLGPHDSQFQHPPLPWSEQLAGLCLPLQAANLWSQDGGKFISPWGQGSVDSWKLSQGELNLLGPLLPGINLGHWEFTWGLHCLNLFEKPWFAVK
nr:uncharacterized protein Fam169b isoform X6 [Rattus norvegicus]